MSALEGTFHGTRERVTWSVTRNDSSLGFGENEEAARADYTRRAKTLHRGETLTLDRLTVAEAWVQRGDVVQRAVKP